jgi:hypothetical protein
MVKILNIVGLLVGFIGAFLAFLDSWRTSSRFTEEGVRLGYEPELKTWFWKNCGNTGFGLITISFLFQLIAICIE